MNVVLHEMASSLKGQSFMYAPIKCPKQIPRATVVATLEACARQLCDVYHSLSSNFLSNPVEMNWPEVKQAADEHRYELVLNGSDVSERIEKGGLDRHIFNLTSLNFLQISNTKLSALPKELENLVNLKTLDLHRNRIQELPSTIGSLKDLKNLDLSGNELQLLPSEMEELTFLQTLNLNCNNLTALPSLKNLKSLSRLDVSFNQLTELPEGIYELEHLAEIYASNNSITTISADVCKLVGLKVLSLNLNKIELIPVELSLCHKLKVSICLGFHICVIQFCGPW